MKKFMSLMLLVCACLLSQPVKAQPVSYTHLDVYKRQSLPILTEDKAYMMLWPVNVEVLNGDPEIKQANRLRAHIRSAVTVAVDGELCVAKLLCYALSDRYAVSHITLYIQGHRLREQQRYP